MNERKYYPFFDGLRGMAILWVILHHIYTEFVYAPPGSPIRDTLSYKVGWAGDWGVDLFFVISGFLITGLLLPKDDRKIDIIRFYQRRCFKILPSYFFLILCVLIFFIGASRTNALFLTNFLNSLPNYLIFIQNIIPSGSPTLDHLWSIAVEEHFYITYPIVIYLIYAGGFRVPAKFRIAIFIIIIIASCNLLRWEMIPYLQGQIQNTLFRADTLAFGCLIKIFEDKIVRWPNPRQCTALCCFMGSMALWCVLIKNAGHYYWFSYTFAYTASGLLIISGLLGLSGIVKCLEFGPLQSVGKISYNLYLWHYPLIFMLYFVSKQYPGFLPFLPFCYLLSIFLMGWLATNTIEKYFLKLRDCIVP